MSKYSDFINTQKEKDLSFFFNGGYSKISNKYFEFKRVIDDNNIIIVTNNIQYWKSKDLFVLIVDNDKVVYLKPWQVREVRNYDLYENSYVVKLNRQYFKPYKLSFNFENYLFKKEDNFDSLLALAKEQEKSNIAWSFGHF